jgi:hypothetical protein
LYSRVGVLCEAENECIISVGTPRDMTFPETWHHALPLQYRGLEHMGSIQPLLHTYSWSRPGPGTCTDAAASGLSRSIVSRPPLPFSSYTRSHSRAKRRLRMTHAHFFRPGTVTANPCWPRTWAYKINRNGNKDTTTNFGIHISQDRLCGLVVKVLGYRSGGPGLIPGTTRKKSSGSGTGSTQPREYN